jgi:hypothetical protein
MSKPSTPIAERLWSRVDKTGECWEWQGPLSSSGYGVIGVGPRGAGLVRTHRLAYELTVGPILDQMQLDHLCQNKRCCNPEHLEPVTQAENMRRAFAEHHLCPRGHELPPKTPPGVRRLQCRVCKSEYDRRRYAERTGA